MRVFPLTIRERLGRRGLILLLFGVMWLAQAAAYFLFGDELTSTTNFWHERLPPVVTGLLWLSSGLVALWSAFKVRGENDSLGFVAVSAMPMLLTTSYGVGVFTRLFMEEWPAATLGMLGFLVYGVLTLVLAVIASWPEEAGGYGNG